MVSVHPFGFLMFVIPVPVLLGLAFGIGWAFRRGWHAADPKPPKEPRSP